MSLRLFNILKERSDKDVGFGRIIASAGRLQQKIRGNGGFTLTLPARRQR
jgi:hypothetical protein